MGQGASANARTPYAKSKYELVTPDAARRKGRAGKETTWPSAKKRAARRSR